MTARRFIAPDSGVKSVSIEGMRTGTTQPIARDKKGFFNAETKSQADALKAEGFIEASLLGSTNNSSLGYMCTACGFNGWFNVCGRCGETAKKVGN